MADLHGAVSLMGKRVVRWFACIGMILGISTCAFSEGLTLEQVIREACTKSDSAKMMKESIVKSDAMVKENWSAAYPKISTSANVTHDEPFEKEEEVAAPNIPPNTPLTWGGFSGMISGFATPKPSTIYSGALSIAQPIYTFGKVGTAIKVAKSFNKASLSANNRNLQNLQLTALDLFYRTMIAMEAAKIAERTLARKNDLYEFIARNFELGSGVKAQMLMVKADALGQSSITIAAKRDAESARMYLNTFLGRPLTDMWTIDTSVIPETLRKSAMVVADTTIKYAVEERNDVRSLRFMAESNRGGAKIYRAMYLPSIFANGSIGYSQIDSKGLMARKGATNWTAGASLSWMLFDGFQNSSKAVQFQSDARKLEIAEGTVKKAAEIEIRSAMIECSAADSTLASAQEMYNASNEGYELASSNFKQGSGLLTDLQKVDEQLQLAELGLINARYGQIRSRAALLVALGQDVVEIEK